MDMIINYSHEPLSIGIVIFRIVLAVVLGGLIGIERGVRSHPAGFRTHILVCVGACLAMLTNQFVFEAVGAGSDPTRIGAQVISGIGFLGVGTIFMAGRNTVKGLTTAAGLWASGAIGLAAGIGFYIGAIIAAAIVLVVLGLFPLLENSMYRSARGLRLHAEFDSIESERAFVAYIAEGGNTIRAKNVVSVSNIEKKITSQYTLRLKHGVESDAFIEELSGLAGVLSIEIQY
jgi:putative Mg2+ transporter-C (MgtC) family protein